MAKVTVDIDLKGIEEKFSEANLQRGRRALANQALADMNQYVPKQEGNLRQASSIDIDGSAINYHSKYAKRQYHAPGGWNYTTPGTGPKWDEKAKGNHGKDWVKAFVKGAGLD